MLNAYAPLHTLSKSDQRKLQLRDTLQLANGSRYTHAPSQRAMISEFDAYTQTNKKMEGQEVREDTVSLITSRKFLLLDKSISRSKLHLTRTGIPTFAQINTTGSGDAGCFFQSCELERYP